MVRLGNLTPERFAEKVETEFTKEELDYLRSVRTGRANVTGPDDFHIFEHPAISVTVVSVDSRVIEVFMAANDRAEFNRRVHIDLDAGWKRGKAA